MKRLRWKRIGYSVGIGITNKCNYSCPHCYSRGDDSTEHDLKIQDIKRLCETLDVSSINFGTGESILHKEFYNITKYLHDREIKIGLTTNGFTVRRMSDSFLQWFNDVDFSLDFPDLARHNHFRGQKAYENVMSGIERCKDNCVECSVVCCLMSTNYFLMDKMVSLIKEKDINLRINLYKPVRSYFFSPTPHQFWNGIKLLLKNSSIISCSEPIANVALKMSGVEPRFTGVKCGNESFRIHPDRTIRPCVYWPYGNRTLDNITENGFYRDEKMSIVPQECEGCAYLSICHGGCPARRVFQDISKPDEFCPFSTGEDITLSRVECGEQVDLVHSSYLCTIIVR